MGPGCPTCRRSPRSWPPPCPPASAPAGAAPPRPSGAGWRAVTWPPGGSLSGAFRKGIPSAASRAAQAPRRPGTRPGPCTAPRPSAGCGRSDGGRRSRPRRNDGGRATRRQAFSGHPVAPLHDHPSDLGEEFRRGERHAVNQTPVSVSVSVHIPRAVARPPAFAGSGCAGSPVSEAGRNRARDPAS